MTDTFIRKSKFYVRLSEDNFKKYLNREFGDTDHAKNILKEFPRIKGGVYLGGIPTYWGDYSGYKTKAQANQLRARVAEFCNLNYLGQVFVYRGSEILK